jgi:hypothetical protein
MRGKEVVHERIGCRIVQIEREVGGPCVDIATHQYADEETLDHWRQFLPEFVADMSE